MGNGYLVDLPGETGGEGASFVTESRSSEYLHAWGAINEAGVRDYRLHHKDR